jgi:predicted 2-oxoglutarate/Fe(II)-dependent dioxygenase YbiX
MPSAVFVIHRFLDATTCAAVRKAMDRGVMEPAEVLADEIERQDEVRRAANVEVDPATLHAIERRLDEQRDTIGAFFDVPVTGREGPSFLRYREGSFYRQHTDRGHLPSWPAAALRRITVVVFLNAGDYRGGVLRIDGTDVRAEAGMLVAFSAAAPHEVTTVAAGTRDAIVDWFY